MCLQKPTVLAKILGVYRIGYRNSQTNTALKQDLLVIENLFYDRNVKQVRHVLCFQDVMLQIRGDH